MPMDLVVAVLRGSRSCHCCPAWQAVVIIVGWAVCLNLNKRRLLLLLLWSTFTMPKSRAGVQVFLQCVLAQHIDNHSVRFWFRFYYYQYSGSIQSSFYSVSALHTMQTNAIHHKSACLHPIFIWQTISYRILSLCPSVLLSCSGIVSRRMKRCDRAVFSIW